ncbi:D-3-phosphoglycerate dehydrogenase [Purpureocillium lilacinum]|uniref:D-3-phosphoglycerate dehydrogenase n=1 Tax=Purpureocillium lilacinum TaxID=33203 RepID=A0A179HXB7_PURLI|nr:D-3-phosphoglycerate dehydrogenase [Purpureocillium lilacinum]OAQ94089.1 D-3-phosphoglycerate dehydrogenase [Purpureocillium lilacinum]
MASQVPNGTAGSKTSSAGGGGITSRDKLLIHAPQPPPPGFLDLLAARFPQLSVRWELARLDPVRSDLASADTLPAEVLDGVTMLSVYPPAKAAAIPDVRFVQLISAGSDRWVGHEKYRDPGVVFCSGSGCHAPQIAEWVMASWLASEHHFDIYKQQQLQGSWSARVADHPVTDSMGRRMAVFGYGSIGRQCAHLGRALGMDVVAYTQRPRPTPASRRLDPGSYAVPGTGDPDGAIPSRWFHGDDAPAALADMLRLGVDLLVLAVPLSDSTRGLVGRREFDLMRDVTASANGGGDPSKRRRPPFLCNIARGPVVDSFALVDALRDGSVRGAALDVTDPEPLPADHPLWTAPNVFITPHVSWQSTAIIDRITDLILENLTRLDEGRPLLNQIKK